jgi:hypothetical protein
MRADPDLTPPPTFSAQSTGRWLDAALEQLVWSQLPASRFAAASGLPSPVSALNDIIEFKQEGPTAGGAAGGVALQAGGTGGASGSSTPRPLRPPLSGSSGSGAAAAVAGGLSTPRSRRVSWATGGPGGGAATPVGGGAAAAAAAAVGGGGTPLGSSPLRPAPAPLAGSGGGAAPAAAAADAAGTPAPAGGKSSLAASTAAGAASPRVQLAHGATTSGASCGSGVSGGDWTVVSAADADADDAGGDGCDPAGAQAHYHHQQQRYGLVGADAAAAGHFVSSADLASPSLEHWFSAPHAAAAAPPAPAAALPVRLMSDMRMPPDLALTWSGDHAAAAAAWAVGHGDRAAAYGRWFDAVGALNAPGAARRLAEAYEAHARCVPLVAAAAGAAAAAAAGA